MSLEKEAAIFLESNKMTATSPTWDRDDKLVFIHDFLVDFANQQTEKLSTELEQTKEKLMMCEEFLRDINLNHALVYRVEQFLSQLKDNG